MLYTECLDCVGELSMLVRNINLYMCVTLQKKYVPLIFSVVLPT